MARQRTKRYVEAYKKVDRKKQYTAAEAIALIPKASYAKFDETVDIAMKLGVDPRHADQMLRGAIVMPSGTGKVVRVVVIASGEALTEAEKAGADAVGSDDIIQKIAAGWFEFDRLIATPDMMGKIGKIGRVLGPRGLMSNPKLGTVTTDVVKAIKEQKAGKVEYRTDKNGIIHIPIGKKSFTPEQLMDNYKAVVMAIVKAKPVSSKGTYIQGITMSTTMGPGIKVDTLEAGTIGI